MIVRPFHPAKVRARRGARPRTCAACAGARTSGMRIRLTTLPRLACHVDDRELTALPNQRRRAALFVYLAVERTATRHTLLDTFWGDLDTDRGRRALSQMLYEIRQDVGGDWVDTIGERLEVRPEVEADAVVFAAAVERQDWDAALNLYHGSFLRGLVLVETNEFDGWLSRRRYHFEKLHLRARRRRIVELLDAGALADALEVATIWAEIDPEEEEAHQRIIELNGLLGRAAAAQRHMASYECYLRTKDKVPLDETNAILDQALAAAAAARRRQSQAPPPASPTGPTPVSAPGAASGDAGLGAPQGGRSPTVNPFPELLPDLEVCDPIGAGSVGRVYMAREPALDRLVAIKVLAPELAGDEVARQRFEREVRAAARIQHPNVAAVHRTGQLASGIPFFVMPYIDGGTLEHRMAATGALPIEDARALIVQLASALAAAHRLGIVHRDVRPSNILFDRTTRRALLADFGLAAVLESGAAARIRLTRTNERLGHPDYVSPEQLRGETPTERTDVYALGVVAFEMLTGRLPFDGADLTAKIKATLAGRPHDMTTFRPDVPRDLAELVGRCLAARPEHRPFAADIAGRP
jgi:DNA-binding SARP family transcriptional activator